MVHNKCTRSYCFLHIYEIQGIMWGMCYRSSHIFYKRRGENLSPMPERLEEQCNSMKLGTLTYFRRMKNIQGLLPQEREISADTWGCIRAEQQCVRVHACVCACCVCARALVPSRNDGECSGQTPLRHCTQCLYMQYVKFPGCFKS